MLSLFGSPSTCLGVKPFILHIGPVVDAQELDGIAYFLTSNNKTRESVIYSLNLETLEAKKEVNAPEHSLGLYITKNDFYVLNARYSKSQVCHELSKISRKTENIVSTYSVQDGNCLRIATDGEKIYYVKPCNKANKIQVWHRNQKMKSIYTDEPIHIIKADQNHLYVATEKKLSIYLTKILELMDDIDFTEFAVIDKNTSLLNFSVSDSVVFFYTDGCGVSIDLSQNKKRNSLLFHGPNCIYKYPICKGDFMYYGRLNTDIPNEGPHPCMRFRPDYKLFMFIDQTQIGERPFLLGDFVCFTSTTSIALYPLAPSAQKVKESLYNQTYKNYLNGVQLSNTQKSTLSNKLKTHVSEKKAGSLQRKFPLMQQNSSLCELQKEQSMVDQSQTDSIFMTLLQLPDEILLKILKYIPFNFKNIAALNLTCKQLRILLEDPKLKRKIESDLKNLDPYYAIALLGYFEKNEELYERLTALLSEPKPYGLQIAQLVIKQISEITLY